MAVEFGTYHLSDNPSMYEPVRTNNFRFYVYDLDNLLIPNEDPNDSDSYTKNGSEVIEFSVVSFDAPHFSQDSIDIARGNSTIHYAGKPKFSNNTLKINDFFTADGKSVLMAWQRCSYDVKDDIIPRVANYKRNAVLLEYLPDNTLIRSWELKGCWVSGLSEDGYTNESSSKKVVTATITFDRAIPTLNKDAE